MSIKELLEWCKSQKKQGNNPEIMAALIKVLSKKEGEPTNPNYQKAIGAYKSFLIGHGLPFIMDARGGKALKEILEKLKNASNQKTDDAALQSFEVILNRLAQTGDYLGRQKSLADINRNLLELIDKIKNGATKKQQHLNQAEQLANTIANKHRTSS